MRIWDAETGMQLEKLFQEHIPSSFCKPDQTQNTQSLANEQAVQLTELTVTDQWIGIAGCKLLYLPFEYRGGEVAGCGSTLVIGARFGAIMFLVAHEA